MDTLEVSFHGLLSEEIEQVLESAKQGARDEHAPVEIDVGGLPFAVSPTGGRGYKWVCSSDEFIIRVAGPESRRNRLFVKCRASALAESGHVALYEKARAVAAFMGATEERGVSRIDLAVDFQGWTPTWEELRNVVCRANHYSVHGSDDTDETFSRGKFPMMVRLYNKTRDATVKGHAWVFERYRDNSEFDPAEEVWRFEAEVGRETLKELGGASVEYVFANLGGILAYAMDWYELRVPKGENQSRWPRDPRWETLARGSFAGTALPRVREAKRAASVRALLPQATGLLVSLAALYGVESPDELWARFGPDMERYLGFRKTSFPEKVDRRRRELIGGRRD